MVNFSKYQGTGNDFVIINNFIEKIEHSPELAVKLCDRHFGIGSDGLIVMEPHPDADYNMVFYNPDGSKSFCGNGSRCSVRFALDSGIIKSNNTNFISTDGFHTALIDGETIELDMHQPVLQGTNYIETQLRTDAVLQVNTGSPHLLLFLNSEVALSSLNIKENGARIRYSETFNQQGINVNFIEIVENGKIKLRTYERGVEDETLSCGTGITAAAIAYHHAFIKSDGSFIIKVKALGGDLEVKFIYKDQQYHAVKLCGPAIAVFSGTF